MGDEGNENEVKTFVGPSCDSRPTEPYEVQVMYQRLTIDQTGAVRKWMRF